MIQLSGELFISYSRADGADFAAWLSAELTSGTEAFPVWLDKQRSRPGAMWDDQIAEAIRSCRTLLFVMTNDSVRSDSTCKSEWHLALKHRKQILPLRADRSAELPFRLEPREFIDFSVSRDHGLARLTAHLAWMNTPDGVLHEMRHQRTEAQRQLLRVEPSAREQLEHDIANMNRLIQAQQKALTDAAIDATIRSDSRRIPESADLFSTRSSRIALNAQMDVWSGTLTEYSRLLSEVLRRDIRKPEIRLTVDSEPQVPAEPLDATPAIVDALDITQRTILVAPAGAGKTSALSRVALELIDSGHLIIFLKLRSGVSDVAKSRETSSITINGLLRSSVVQINESAISQMGRELPQGRRIVWVVDGLNEVPAGRANQILELMDEATRRTLSLRAIATDRGSDRYEGSGWKVIILNPVDRRVVEVLLQNTFDESSLNVVHPVVVEPHVLAEHAHVVPVKDLAVVDLNV